MKRFRASSARWLIVLILVASLAPAQNLEDGKDVYGPCAACHGANGQGGKGGEYPRIAGQPAAFIIDSLKSFQSRKRYNLPMIPYTEPRELSERDMKDVAAYVESMVLPTKMPVLPSNAGALERLEALEKVLIIPNVKGDIEKGRAQFLEECAECHGKNGRGRASREAPGLVGQYSNYLVAQFKQLKTGPRAADEGHPMHGLLDEMTEQQFTDVLAFLTSIQSQDDDGVRATDAGVTVVPDAGAPR